MLASSVGTKLLLLAVLALASSGAQTNKHRQFNVLEHLATKTPYAPLQSFEDHTAPPATCTAVHLDMAVRHGTRNPSDGDIEEFDGLELQITRHANDLAAPYTWIAGWKNPIPLVDEGKLSPIGLRENYDMARRFMAAFPNLFEQSYNSSVYFFRSTQEQRAMLSAESFAFGLFEGRGSLGLTSYSPVYILADTESQDDVLKFYDNCPLYNLLVNDNETANIESGLYLDSVIGNISMRLTNILTVNRSWQVTAADTLAMWAACQSEGNREGVADKWCALFTEQEVQQLEYWEDLDDYYTKAYPYEVNYRIVAPLLQDMTQAMLAVVRDGSPQKANLRFGHSSTIVPLTTAFGLYHDATTLRHDSPQSVIDNRVFRTSVVSRKGTNVAIVLYSCADGYKIKVLQSEQEVIVAGCGELFCPLERFLQAYESYLSMNYDAYCAVPEERR